MRLQEIFSFRLSGKVRGALVLGMKQPGGMVMRKLVIVCVAATAFILMLCSAEAFPWGGDQELGDNQAVVSEDFSAQARRTRRSAPRRARPPTVQTPAHSAPAGVRQGLDPDPHIQLEMLRNRGHAG
jgi:hypothetical protein